MSLSGEILLGISKSCSSAFRQNAGCTRTPRLADVARGCSLVRQGSSVLQLGSLVLFRCFCISDSGRACWAGLTLSIFSGILCCNCSYMFIFSSYPLRSALWYIFLLSMGFDISVKKVLVNHYYLL